MPDGRSYGKFRGGGSSARPYRGSSLALHSLPTILHTHVQRKSRSSGVGKAKDQTATCYDEAALFGGGVADSVARCLNSHIIPGARAPWRRLSVVLFPCVGVCGYPGCTLRVPSVATRVVAKIYRPICLL